MKAYENIEKFRPNLCTYNKNIIQVMPKLIVSNEKLKICFNLVPVLEFDPFLALILITFINKVIIVNKLNAITIKAGPKKYLNFDKIIYI
jgi:hypothetical protein